MFWQLTLREIDAILVGVNARLMRERNENMVLAWHIAALERQKKLPKLKDMMAEKPRRQTPEQMQEITRGWLAGRKRKPSVP